MATDKPDTDPSTPSARAARPDGRIAPEKIVAIAPNAKTTQRMPNAPSTQPGTPPAPMAHADTEPLPRAPSTDPGVAPPPQRNAMQKPTPVAVPLPQIRNDSIDVLLDGIAGDTQKKVAESRGEASLAYAGGEHLPPTARKTPVPEAPVIVRRREIREMPETMKLDRAVVDAAIAQAKRRPGDTTVLVPRTQGPRVVIALFAAIAVVLAVFMVMNAWSARLKRAAMAADPSASELVTTPPPGAWNPGASTSAVAAPSATPTAPATSAAATTATAASSSAAPKSPRPKATGTATATANGSDLGEFKPSIHH